MVCYRTSKWAMCKIVSLPNKCFSKIRNILIIFFGRCSLFFYKKMILCSIGFSQLQFLIFASCFNSFHKLCKWIILIAMFIFENDDKWNQFLSFQWIDSGRIECSKFLPSFDKNLARSLHHIAYYHRFQKALGVFVWQTG